MCLSLHVKHFSFRLLNPLETSQKTLRERKGWVLKIQEKSGITGWGEVSPIDLNDFKVCKNILKDLGQFPSRRSLEASINKWPGAMGFGVGAALAEIDFLITNNVNRYWLKSPPSAHLLPANKSLLIELESLIQKNVDHKHSQSITFKWKVGRESQDIEEKLLEEILIRLPENALLRLDANSGWDFQQAFHWAKILRNETRLEWLEQPLSIHDIKGAIELSQLVPIALDESLIDNPTLKSTWKDWQVRRPVLDGDPRILLKELKSKRKKIVISTSFETGIGRRWVEHFAALQQNSPSPTAPGLAPGWCPTSPLFSNDPQIVWESI